jgi:hypothetical protein
MDYTGTGIVYEDGTTVLTLGGYVSDGCTHSERVVQGITDGCTMYYEGTYDIVCDDGCTNVGTSIGEISKVDPDCKDYPQTANTIAASYGRASLIGSGVFNSLALLFLPVGAVILLRIWGRKR